MWRAIGASVPGTSHTSAGRGCDDSSGWLHGAGTVCLIAADGAGSRPLSAYGSRIAVDTVLEFGAALRDGEATMDDPGAWLTDVFTEVHRRIETVANGSDHDPYDYATTLAVAVLAGEVLAIGQVGDTIAVVGGPGGYRTVGPAEQHEYANETEFVTREDFAAHLRLDTVEAEGIDEIFLSTDGLRYKILDDLRESVPYEPFFADLAAYARSAGATPDAVARFLEAVDDQTGDDLTVVAAVRMQEPAAGS
ncbi:protein phosphatase 2C domain-containing protein [Couchioplanes caeruleus]|uniref:PP2C family serine/threonine-protein phosphatase n=1 Tax=Couchioplanes caeruleus TaxID=56438 RepID=UPI0020BE5C77|nr:PP2C family serine/threonine-protein phosphatase [Couchioplanes caeruleus]UQU62692.1 protein phosphatase 2C domain-containing protein [Couchioplanes caeruleus]